MLQKLPLTVEPTDRETLPSLFSRMAAINGTDAGGFALDIGVNFRRILDQEKVAVATFAARAGLAPSRLADLLSWTGERAGDVRMRFREEVFVSRALRNPVVRGCPRCLREAAGKLVSPLSHMAMAGDWLCRGVDVCLRHRQPLVPLWTSPRPDYRYDTCARLAEILPDLLSGRFDRDPIKPSAYDLWIDRRLTRGEDNTWLANQPLFAAMTFCVLLGAELMRVQSLEVQDRTAKALGFDVASRGPEAIANALDRLTRAGDGGHSVTPGALGTLYQSLNRLYRNDESFDGFRDILRSYLLRIWPVAAGDVILGKIVPERRLHSLVTASKEIGIGTAVLDNFLTEAGAFAADDQRSDARKTFDAGTFQPLLDEIPTLVGPIAMRKAIGATRAELISLEADGILVPRTKVPTIKSPWRLSDGLTFVQELEDLAIPLDAETPGWETIQYVQKRLGLSVGQVIAAIREGTLMAGKRSDVFGYHGVVVKCAEADQLKVRLSRDARSESQEPMDCELAAAEFARSVGVRQRGAFLALIEGGHISATEVLHPATKRKQWRMTEADVTAFHAKFTTTTMMAQETGLHRNTIRAALVARGIKAFRPNGVDVGPVYLRGDLASALKALKG